MPEAALAGVLSYQQVLENLSTGRAHLLLGNGFSIACDPIFRYSSLYDAAVAAGLSPRAQALFDRLGTNNFEGVLRLLDDAHWVASKYGISASLLQPFLDDAEIVKQTLVEAVTHSHLDHTGCVSDARKDAARRLLDRYHNAFTTNYDLLLYWTALHTGTASHQDGFRADQDDPEAPYLVFSERLGDNKGLYYLHGALHLYLAGGELRKHSWLRTGQRLTDLIRGGLAEGQYPLFVAEGSPEKKLDQIQRSGYLWYALDKFSRIEGPLVVFGHSLGASDQHIADAIAGNTKLRSLYVGLHGDPNSDPNLAIRRSVARIEERRAERSQARRGARRLTVSFYDSTTARPWG